MSQQRIGMFRKAVLATISAATLFLGAVSSALASSGGGSFPEIAPQPRLDRSTQALRSQSGAGSTSLADLTPANADEAALANPRRPAPRERGDPTSQPALVP